MSYLAKCDRCGTQEPVKGVMVAAPARLLPTLRPELPDGWSRYRLPDADGSAWDRELCGNCRADLIGWLGEPATHEPQAADPGAVAPALADLETAEGVERLADNDRCVLCAHQADAHTRVGEGCCDCRLSEAEATDPGWSGVWLAASQRKGMVKCPVCGNGCLADRLNWHMRWTHPEMKKEVQK